MIDSVRLIALELYQSGGFVMTGIFILSLYLYPTAFRSLLTTSRIARPYRGAEELLKREDWARELVAPWDRFIEDAVDSDLDEDDLRYRFKRARDRLRRAQGADLLRMKILIAAAPLLGLLGTIIGMIDTFGAISHVTGSDTSLMVSRGISKALLTTNAGIMVALPALFISYFIRRKLKQALAVAGMFERALRRPQTIAKR